MATPHESLAAQLALRVRVATALARPHCPSFDPRPAPPAVEAGAAEGGYVGTSATALAAEGVLEGAPEGGGERAGALRSLVAEGLLEAALGGMPALVQRQQELKRQVAALRGPSLPPRCS